MPRPIKYEKSELEAMILAKEEQGLPIKLQCREKGYPYVSVNKALKKYGLSIPKKYAEVKAKLAGTTKPEPKAKKVKKAKVVVATPTPVVAA